MQALGLVVLKSPPKPKGSIAKHHISDAEFKETRCNNLWQQVQPAMKGKVTIMVTVHMASHINHNLVQLWLLEMLVCDIVECCLGGQGLCDTN